MGIRVRKMGAIPVTVTSRNTVHCTLGLSGSRLSLPFLGEIG